MSLPGRAELGALRRRYETELLEAADWEAFSRTDAYAFSHLPDPQHGEWYRYLDRRGEVTHRFKGGPYKGCFHVPRALWLCWRLLQELETEA